MPDVGALLSRLWTLSPKGTPVPGLTRHHNRRARALPRAQAGAPPDTAPCQDAHTTITKHRLQEASPPLPTHHRRQRDMPWAPKRRLQEGSGTKKFRRRPIRVDHGFSPRASGGIRSKPRRRLQEESGAHGRRRRRPGHTGQVFTPAKDPYPNPSVPRNCWPHHRSPLSKHHVALATLTTR
jgi:hypothetical protein